MTWSECLTMRSSFFSTYPLREEVTSTWWPVTFSCMEASFDSSDWNLLTLARRRNAERLAIFGDRAPRDQHALARQDLGDAAVRERLVRLLGRHQLADLGADRRRRHLGAVARSDVAGKKVAKLEHAAMRVHVLVGGDARDRRLVHLHGLGDVLEDHRLHGLVAVLEERGLPLHDAARDFQQRLVADFQAANQPARFLQLRAQHRVIGGAADESGVALIDADARQAGRIDVDGPAALCA